MAVELEVRTKVDTSQSSSSIDRLIDKMDQILESQEAIADQSKNTSKEVKTSMDNNTKSIKKATESTNGLAKGFKGVGLALKAAGIGVVIGLLNSLKDVLLSNQKIADQVSTVFETISIVFNKFADVITSVVDRVSETTSGFEGLTAVMKGLLTIALTPIKLAFNQIVLAIKVAQLAWEQSFFGDDDPKEVARLKFEILEVKDAMLEIGKEAFDAGKSIVDNFGKAVNEVSQVVEGTIEGVKEISIEASFEAAKAIVELNNQSKIAAAQQQRLVEQYDRQAEKLRQLRDNDLKDINERIQSNEKLSKVLDDQEEALLRQADLQIKAAQANVDKNNSIENQIALTEALSNKDAILAQIEGFRSEQLSNQVALNRELLDLEVTRSDAEQERALRQAEFDAEQQDTELARLQSLRDNLVIEEEILLQDLERKKEIYAEGTQARQDAEQEYFNTVQDLRFREFEINQSIAKEEENIAAQKEAAKVSLAKQGAALITELAGAGTEAAKGVAVAATIFDTYRGIQAIFASAAANPQSILFPGYPFVQASIAAGFGFANVRKILSTNTKAPSVGSASVGSGGGTSAGGANASQQQIVPNFDFAGGGGNGIQGAAFREPVKAVVIGQDVENQKALSSKIDQAGRVGS